VQWLEDVSLAAWVKAILRSDGGDVLSPYTVLWLASVAADYGWMKKELAREMGRRYGEIPATTDKPDNPPRTPGQSGRVRGKKARD
jgi:hypothetical protein